MFGCRIESDDVYCEELVGRNAVVYSVADERGVVYSADDDDDDDECMVGQR
jgi:hypothetical protein